MTSTSKKPDSKLDELAALKAQRNASLKAPSPPATPPVQDITVNLTDTQGEEHSTVLSVRVFNRDEMLEVYRLAALYAGIDYDILGQEGQTICLSRALVEVMWKNKVPEWLKTAMAEDEGVSIQLANAINSHRAAWFRGDYRTGEKGKKAAGLEIVPVRPATPPEK